MEYMSYVQTSDNNRCVRYVRMYAATVRTTDKPHMGTHEQSFICIDIKKTTVSWTMVTPNGGVTVIYRGLC